nr:nucleotidyltransferase domain-containing protein [Lachnospiraceae bacterium]
SYARGEETPTSDVDIMVELNREMGLDFFELFEVFEKALDKKVDVLTRNEVYDIMPKSFERDKILLYERDS